MKKQSTQIAIIGAGPSGLAAANAATYSGMDYLLIEQGSEINKRTAHNPTDLSAGVGGAGLFSDGKLSYYPSGHILYSLRSLHALKHAYSWIHSLISDFYSEYPSFPENTLDDVNIYDTKTTFHEKKYKSFCLSDSQKTTLLNRLVVPVEHRIIIDSRVTSIEWSNGIFLIKVVNSKSQVESEIIAKQIIYCGGRFGPIALFKMMPQINKTYHRFEYGVRIEQPADSFLFKDKDTVDTKLILSSPDSGVEWRTFCCCRNGVVLLSRFSSLSSYSGALTDQYGNKSNIGFNVRVTNIETFNKLHSEIKKIFEGQSAPAKHSFKDFVNACSKGAIFGLKLDEYLLNGLQRLGEQYDLSAATVYSPCIEGVGYYPWTSTNLEAQYPGFFIAGDSVGTFRGLLQSIVSGFYSGLQASKHFKNEKELESDLDVNRSSIARMPLVFTAQSKKFFYCRDAVCQYVMERGGLPINPFRVFDYFLGDRVDRDIIRRGNNQLVQSCDELWVFGPVADGVLFEIVYALNIQKPVKFFTVGTRSSEIMPINDINKISFEPEIHAPGVTREDLLRAIRQVNSDQPSDQIKLPF